MNKRGMAVEFLMALTVGVVVVVVGIYWITGGSKNFGKANDCVLNGGTCKDACDILNPAYSATCPNKQICCKNPFSTGSGDGTTTDPNTGPVDPTFALGTQLRKPTVTLKYAADTTAVKIPVGQSLTWLAGMDTNTGDQSASKLSDLQLTTRVEFFSSAYKEKDGKTTICPDVKKICSAEEWTIKIVLQDVLQKSIQDYTCDKMANCAKNPETEPLGIDCSASTAMASDKVNQKLNIGTKVCTLTQRPSLADKYAGQTLRLVVIVTPNKKEGVDTTAYESQTVFPIKVLYPVRITQGLTNTWSQEKTATVVCDQNFVRCSDIYFAISSDKDKCPSIAEGIKGGMAPKKLSEVTKKYYIYDLATKKPREPSYATLDACTTAESGILNPTYSAALTPFLKVLQTQGTADAQLTNAFLGISQTASRTNCRSTEEIKEVSQLELDKLYYAADNFDSAKQSATIKLRDAKMAGQYLCVYGVDVSTDVQKDGKIANTKLYSGGKGQKIYVDRTPPQVDVKFDPLSLKIQFFCQDGDPADLNIRESGCKDAFGVSYISDATKFLPALVSGPQSATTWCAKSGYSTELRRVILYNTPEIRVLCLQGTDKAGNSAVSMATVFNSYDLLARGILLYMQEKNKP